MKNTGIFAHSDRFSKFHTGYNPWLQYLPDFPDTCIQLAPECISVNVDGYKYKWNLTADP